MDENVRVFRAMNKVLFFLACVFLGMGIGTLFGRIDVGTVMGIGTGLLLIALAPSTSYSRKIHPGSRRIISSTRLFIGVIGIGFILWGLDMLGIINMPGTFWQHLGAFILILIGIGFLYASLS